MTDVVWNGMIAGIVTLGLAWIQYRNSQAQAVASMAAAKMAAKLNVIEKTGDVTHKLVNNAMAVQLKLNASVTKRLAIMTRDPEDEAVADQSEKMLREHLAQQEKACA